jgi:hypothetical protein
MSKQQNAILWPEGYTPGFTENFASNEIIAAGLSAADVASTRHTIAVAKLLRQLG